MNLIKLYIDSFSGLSKDIWAVALIYLVNRSGEMVIPFMTVYMATQLGFTKLETGIAMMCFGAGAMIGSNIGGYLTDNIGNFKVMVLSLSLTGFAFMGIMMFETFYLLSLWLFVTAICSAMFSPAAFSAVSLWGKPENRTRGFSLLRMAINLGVAIGPAIGGFLAYNYGYNWLFILDGITCFCAVATLFLVLRHRDGKRVVPKDEQPNKMSPYKDPILLLFLFFNLINMVAFFQIIFSVPVYFKEEVMMDEFLIGMFFTANGILVFLLEMPLVSIIEKKKRYFQPMIAGAILIGVAYACLTLFDNPLIAIILYSFLVALGEVINFPLIPSLAMRRGDEQNQGKYMGVVSMMFAMAFTLAPVSGLPLIEKIGYDNYWIAAAVMSVLSGICLWFLKPYFALEQKS